MSSWRRWATTTCASSSASSSASTTTGRGRRTPGCYNCGDLNHFIADCPKKSGGGQNNSFNYYRHRDCDEGGSNKERRRHKHRSHDRGGRFDKESLKKRFQYKAKNREKAFLAQLSDLDKSSDTDLR